MKRIESSSTGGSLFRRLTYSTGIGTKIWFGAGVIVAGYMLSMFMGFRQGMSQEELLGRVSDQMFPTSQCAQQAVASFNRQTKLYNDTVIMGETELLETAREEADATIASLESVVAMNAGDGALALRAGTLLSDLRTYSDEAEAVYGALAGFDATSADQKRAVQLSSSMVSLIDGLGALNVDAATCVTNELKGMAEESNRQLQLRAGVFVVVFVGSMVLFYFLISSGITGPLKRAARVAGAVRDGDLSKRINYQSGDEIGQLSQDLDEMADGLEHKAALAEKISSGDLTVKVIPQSQKDVLGKALLQEVSCFD